MTIQANSVHPALMLRHLHQG